MESDVPFEMDRVARVAPGREAHRSTAGGRRGCNRAVDRRRVQCLAVALGSKCLDVVLARGGHSRFPGLGVPPLRLAPHPNPPPPHPPPPPELSPAPFPA